MSNEQIRRGRNCVSSLKAHLVFVTKYRKKVFTNEHLMLIEKVTKYICEKNKTVLIEFNGEENHVHILINYPPTVQLSKLINSIKGVSSRRLKQSFTHLDSIYYKGALWSPSYYIGSIGNTSLEIVKKYIEDQNRPS